MIAYTGFMALLVVISEIEEVNGSQFTSNTFWGKVGYIVNDAYPLAIVLILTLAAFFLSRKSPLISGWVILALGVIGLILSRIALADSLPLDGGDIVVLVMLAIFFLPLFLCSLVFIRSGQYRRRIGLSPNIPADYLKRITEFQVAFSTNASPKRATFWSWLSLLFGGILTLASVCLSVVYIYTYISVAGNDSQAIYYFIMQLTVSLIILVIGMVMLRSNIHRLRNKERLALRRRGAQEQGAKEAVQINPGGNSPESMTGPEYLSAPDERKDQPHPHWRSVIIPSSAILVLSIIIIVTAIAQDRNLPPRLESAEAYFNRGYAFYNQGELTLAIRDYDQVILLNPNYINAYIDRGVANDDINNWDQAIQDYDRAIQLDPDNEIAYTNRGNTYTSKGEFEQAIMDYDMAIQLNPNYAQAYGGRGIAYENEGEIEKSIQDFEIGLELCGSNSGLCQVCQQELDRLEGDQ